MKSFILWLLIAGSFSVSAQDSSMQFIPMATLSIGGSFQKFDGLNARIAGLQQFKQLKDYTATLGLGWLKERKRLISAGGITAGSSMSGKHNEVSSAIRYLGADADLGFDLVKSNNIMFYPLAGIGYQRYQAIFYKDNSGVSFNDVLQLPGVQDNIGSVRFNNAFVVYKFGLGFSLRSPKYPSNSIGIQAGYIGSFKRNNWKSNEGQSLANAPSDKISQFYVGLVFTNKPMFMR